MEDIEDTGTKLIINIPDTKNKISRSFLVSGSFYPPCKKYLNLRKNVEIPGFTQFFINYQQGKCTKQVVGINKIGNVPKQIALFLMLPNPKLYTGHCLRRSSATILVDSGGDLLALKRHGGWKSSTVAEGYVDNSASTKISTACKIVNSIENNPPEKYVATMPSTSSHNEIPFVIPDNNFEESSTFCLQKQIEPKTILNMPCSSSTTLHQSQQPIIIKNCSNCTITFNYPK